MAISVDIVVKQKFVKVIDTEEEAEEFGKEASEISYAFLRGFGDYDPESQD